MQTLDNGRIRIIGSAVPPPISSRDARSVFDDLTSEFHLNDYFRVVQEGGEHVFQNNAIYFGSAVTGTPMGARDSEKVDLPFNRSSFRGMIVGPLTSAGRRTYRDDLIKFTFAGKRTYRAIFFIRSRTLCFGNLSYLYRPYASECMTLIMDFLRERNLIALLPPIIELNTESAVEPVPCKTKVEFHRGEKRVLAIPLAQMNECTVGCDPEFEWLEPISREPARPPGRFCGTRADQQIGVDGAGAQIELRPPASTDPARTISSMCTIMQRLTGEHLSVRGDRFPLGGHIHIGVGRTYQPPSDLVWLLDYFLGKPTYNLSGSARSSYKKLSAWETKPWGFEYRTPPAAIFMWPEFSRLAMKICKHATESFISCQTIEVNATPHFEDYYNYCGFSPREYERWMTSLERYKDFMANPGGYSRNVVGNWIKPDPTIPLLPSQERLQAQAQEQAQAAEQAGRQAREQAEEQAQVRQQDQAQAEERTHAPETMSESGTQQPPEPSSLDTPSININFRDDWLERRRAIFRDNILPQLRLSCPPESHPGSITLFGLAANRGNATYGYACHSRQLAPEESSPTWEGYGVPLSVRFSEGEHQDDLAGQHARSIAADIIARMERPEGMEEEPPSEMLCDLPARSESSESVSPIRIADPF